jgi:hypothetical protein
MIILDDHRITSGKLVLTMKEICCVHNACIKEWILDQVQDDIYLIRHSECGEESIYPSVGINLPQG